MSKFLQSALPFTDRELLIECLTNKEWGLGIPKEKIDLTPNRKMVGYAGFDHGDEFADITILGGTTEIQGRRHYHKDIGFKLQDDGTYALKVNDVNLNLGFQEKIEQIYPEGQVRKQLAETMEGQEWMTFERKVLPDGTNYMELRPKGKQKVSAGW